MTRYLAPPLMRPLGAALMAAAAAVLIGRTLAQTMATYDPNQLPAMHGTVALYSLTPRGDVDGVILADGTQVHMPPHLGARLVAAVKPGDAVTFHGLHAQALPLVQALSLSNDATKQTVADAGPAAGAPAGRLPMGFQWQQADGRVREALYGPRGDLNGALLDDGTQVHLPPDQAAALATYLAPGRTLVARGYGATGPYGRSIDAAQLGPAADALVQVAGPGASPGAAPGGPEAAPGPGGRPPPPPPPPAPQP